MSSVRICRICNRQKSISEFYKRSDGKCGNYDTRCKDCVRERSTVYYKEHVELRAVWHKEYRKKNKEKIYTLQKQWIKLNPGKDVARRERFRLKKFNLTAEQYREILNIQEGCCGICVIHQSKLTEKLHIDHNHITGKVRGLLCRECNRILGTFKDSVEWLDRAKLYLQGENK